jgi:hypothetical protein
MININITTEQAERMQRKIESHLNSCVESIDFEGDCDTFVNEDGELFEPYGPFCGCDTCITREQLMVTFDFLRKANIVDINVSDE